LPVISPPKGSLRDPVLAELWLEIDELTDQKGSSYGVIKTVITNNKDKFPWITTG
jgi:hypothetical protein